MVNATVLEKELDWLKEVIDLRFQLYFDNKLSTDYASIEEVLPPILEPSDYAKTVQSLQLGFEERLAIALCLAVHLQPAMLDVFFHRNETFNRYFTEFGGVYANDRGSFVPSGETLIFILAGNDISKKLKVLNLLHHNHVLFQQGILELIPQTDHFSTIRQNSSIRLTPEYEARWIYGQSYQPEFNTRFPASPLTPPAIDWNEGLILPRTTKKQLEEIKLWIAHKDRLEQDWKVGKQLRPGFRALFYGPPGTGKTLTASLLGVETGKAVYRVDLSMVISKYIGETEKNLARVFNIAAHKDWILFFDEADALFGKRTETQSSHDRYANQEIAYLLQRFETFDGISLLATNLRDNIDEAFTRRFESIIYFPLPEPDQRLKLWQKVLPTSDTEKFAAEIDLNQIAEKYKLSGGAIVNVARHASLHAIANGGRITAPLLLEGIQREFSKEGRMI